jgi:hypothetical protein
VHKNGCLASSVIINIKQYAAKIMEGETKCEPPQKYEHEACSKQELEEILMEVLSANEI